MRILQSTLYDPKLISYESSWHRKKEKIITKRITIKHLQCKWRSIFKEAMRIINAANFNLRRGNYTPPSLTPAPSVTAINCGSGENVRNLGKRGWLSV
jgi:hypothetical protein